MEGCVVQDQEFLNYSDCNKNKSTFLGCNMSIKKITLAPKWIMDYSEVKRRRKKKRQLGGLQESIQEIVDIERSRWIHLLNMGYREMKEWGKGDGSWVRF